MRLLGAKKLARQLSDLPETVRDNVGNMIYKSVKRGVRVARTLAPVDTGQLKRWIHGRVEETDNGIYGIIDAAPDAKEAQQKARAVEFGRKEGDKGTTEANSYIRTTQSYLSKSFKSSVKRAINKAAKEAVRG